MIGVNCGPNMASLVSGLPLHGSQIRTMRLVALHPEPLPAHGKPLFQGAQIDEPTLPSLSESPMGSQFCPGGIRPVKGWNRFTVFVNASFNPLAPPLNQHY